MNFILAVLEGIRPPALGQPSSCSWLNALPGHVNLQYLHLKQWMLA